MSGMNRNGQSNGSKGRNGKIMGKAAETLGSVLCAKVVRSSNHCSIAFAYKPEFPMEMLRDTVR